MFEQKVSRYIEEKKLLRKSDNILVAVSGGADSVALLYVLVHLGYTCKVAHCNFCLRGEESVRDEEFVKRLCDKLRIPFYTIRFDTREYASNRKISLEMAARELRYEWFEQLCKQIGTQVVAVAHHRNDSVETFLLNLIRGTGIKGMKGIASINGNIVRPLLNVTKEEILAYLSTLNQPYMTDTTNLQDEYTRNKIRLNILPALKEINPSVENTIAEECCRLADIETIYRIAINEACKKVKTADNIISISALMAEPAPQAILYELLNPAGFNATQIKNIANSLTAQSGKLFYTDQWTLLKDRDSLILRPRNCTQPIPQLHTEVKEVNAFIPQNRFTACLDADKITIPPTLRKWQTGDFFMPQGMKKFKKVRNYLRDRKLSLFDKENQYVVTSGDDIIWIVNERPDERFCITEATRRILILQVY